MYERVEYRPSALRGKKPLPAVCALYTQKERGSAAFSGLNHRFTATFLWSTPDAHATSSVPADPPCTMGLG